MSGKGNLASLRTSSQADLFQLLLLFTCLMGAAGLEALGTGGTPKPSVGNAVSYEMGGRSENHWGSL